MKRLLLISSDPNFFESRDYTFNRRGVDAFPALDIVEGAEILMRVPMDLTLVDAREADAVQLHEDVKAIIDTVPMPVILIVPGKDEDVLRSAFADLASVFLVPFPVSTKYLLELSNRLISIPNRKYVRVLVQMRIPGEKSSTIFSFSRNISETGILIETEASLRLGDLVGLNFMLPGVGGGTPIDARGEIVRMQDPEAASSVRLYGVRFTDIGVSERDVIAAYTR